MAFMIITAICRYPCSPASMYCVHGCGRATSTPSAGSRKEIARIVGQIRKAWPEVKITLRGDSGILP